MKRYALVLVLMLAGCQTMTPGRDDPLVSASLKAPCPDLPRLTGGTGADITRWSVRTASMYKLCQSRHEALVEAIEPKK